MDLLKIKKHIENFSIMGDYGSGAMCVCCKAEANIPDDDPYWDNCDIEPTYYVEAHEDGCEFFSAIGGMNDFAHAYRGQVAVALVGENDHVGPEPLETGGQGRGTTVRRF